MGAGLAPVWVLVSLGGGVFALPAVVVILRGVVASSWWWRSGGGEWGLRPLGAWGCAGGVALSPLVVGWVGGSDFPLVVSGGGGWGLGVGNRGGGVGWLVFWFWLGVGVWVG